MKSSSRVLAAAGGALATALLAGTVVLAATVNGSGGAVTAVKTATANNLILTTSATPVDVPAMSTTVNVPSGQRALLVITFTAEMQCNHDGNPDPQLRCKVQAVVDGNPVAPGAANFGFTDQGPGLPDDLRTMQWVAASVGPGNHTVKIRWWVDTEAADPLRMFRLDTRTLTVLRSKQP